MFVSQKRIEANRRNALKAGRPKGDASILAEKARAYIAQRIDENLTPILDKAIEQANAGIGDARAWLFNRAHGTPLQSVDISSRGESLNKPNQEALKVAKEFESKLKSMM